MTMGNQFNERKWVTLKQNRQNKTPFFTKLKEYGLSDAASFDVPGHKLGRINNDLMNFIGKNTFLLDSNAPLGLDNLSKPTGIIKEAQDLMAEACYADKAYFLTNGTTIGILAMIMSTCKANDKIILPRNVHKSVINGLILSGAMPIFVKPNIDADLGIANGVSLSTYEEAINAHPDAKAVLIINPTYFGVVSDIRAITDLAHEHNMLVLVDEAHGSQFYFSRKLPFGAMEAGVDICATSFHKTAGSLTQSSVILTKGELVDHTRLRATLNILQSTSPSAILLASLDVARKKMYFEGAKEIDKLIQLANNARERLSQIPGIKVIDRDYITSRNDYDFDQTRLVIKVSGLGLTGFDVYYRFRKKYNIQFELAETHIVLCVLTIGNNQDDIERLCTAFMEMSTMFHKSKKRIAKFKFDYPYPETYARPRDAYHAPKRFVSLDEANNEVSAESIMIYPPGIPLIIPGEIINQKVIDDINYYVSKGSVLLSDLDNGMVKIVDKENWMKWDGDSHEF